MNRLNLDKLARSFNYHGIVYLLTRNGFIPRSEKRNAIKAYRKSSSLNQRISQNGNAVYMCGHKHARCRNSNYHPVSVAK